MIKATQRELENLIMDALRELSPNCCPKCECPVDIEDYVTLEGIDAWLVKRLGPTVTCAWCGLTAPASAHLIGSYHVGGAGDVLYCYDYPACKVRHNARLNHELTEIGGK